jgi:hypothetical protein
MRGVSLSGRRAQSGKTVGGRWEKRLQSSLQYTLDIILALAYTGAENRKKAPEIEF